MLWITKNTKPVYSSRNQHFSSLHPVRIQRGERGSVGLFWPALQSLIVIATKTGDAENNGPTRLGLDCIIATYCSLNKRAPKELKRRFKIR